MVAKMGAKADLNQVLIGIWAQTDQQVGNLGQEQEPHPMPNGFVCDMDDLKRFISGFVSSCIIEIEERSYAARPLFACQAHNVGSCLAEMYHPVQWYSPLSVQWQ